ncbi:Bromodomain-containing protein 7 [Trichoplax sp. H2]|nr:Bromodomain-containing protein 7 [Trichoplax sp. H2]|eukprot:RDD47156.1 Bromodomain-containing protein 7 [Trichoplax sp. H2]
MANRKKARKAAKKIKERPEASKNLSGNKKKTPSAAPIKLVLKVGSDTVIKSKKRDSKKTVNQASGKASHKTKESKTELSISSKTRSTAREKSTSSIKSNSGSRKRKLAARKSDIESISSGDDEQELLDKPKTKKIKLKLDKLAVKSSSKSRKDVTSFTKDVDETPIKTKVSKLIFKPMPESSQKSKKSISPVREKPINIIDEPSLSPEDIEGSNKRILRLSLLNLVRTLQRKDVDSIFAEPVTDDVAPGYSKIISNPMDLSTIKKKVNRYDALDEFQSDFELMCNNAMTYNDSSTIFYKCAKKMRDDGLILISKEHEKLLEKYNEIKPEKIQDNDISSRSRRSTDSSLRISHKRNSLNTSNSMKTKSDLVISDSLTSNDKGRPENTSKKQHLSYDKKRQGTRNERRGVSEQTSIDVDVVNIGEDVTKSTRNRKKKDFQDHQFTAAKRQLTTSVQAAAKEAANNIAKQSIKTNYGHFKRKRDGTTVLSVVNPSNADDEYEIIADKKVNLESLKGPIVSTSNQSLNDLKSMQVKQIKPVEYLRYGNFSSFAPIYDTTASNLSKDDSDLILSAYGNSTALNYSRSLQRFVRNCSSYMTDFVDDILNSMTDGEHNKVIKRFKLKENETFSASKSSSGLKSENIKERDDKMDDKSKIEGGTREGGVDNESKIVEEHGNTDNKANMAEKVDRTTDDNKMNEKSDTSVKNADSSLTDADNANTNVDNKTEYGTENRTNDMSDYKTDNELAPILSLGKDGIDISFLTNQLGEKDSVEAVDNSYSISVKERLDENTRLLGELKEIQTERLTKPHAVGLTGGKTVLVKIEDMSDKEKAVANKLADNLTQLSGLVQPGNLISVESLRSAMGIEISEEL